jgi:uncharacterized membrane protein
MVIHRPRWHEHPHVRTGDELSLGERAADRLKAAFGSWTFLICLNVFIAVWCILNATKIVHFDIYPFIALNLILSWLAAQQGGALQIAANRGDRISSELAMHTFENGQQILQINQQQSELLGEIHKLQQQLAALTTPEPPAAD